MGEDTAGFDATADANSGNVRIRVTGAAATNLTWEAYAVVRLANAYV